MCKTWRTCPSAIVSLFRFFGEAGKRKRERAREVLNPEEILRKEDPYNDASAIACSRSRLIDTSKVFLRCRRWVPWLSPGFLGWRHFDSLIREERSTFGHTQARPMSKPKTLVVGEGNFAASEFRIGAHWT